MSTQLIPIVQTLCLVPSLGKVNSVQLTDMATQSQLRQLEDGEFLYLKDQPVDHLVIVHKGRLEMSSANASGRRFVMSYLEMGGVVGLLSMLDDFGSNHDVRSVGASSVVMLPKTVLLKCATDNAELMQGMVRQLCMRVRQLNDDLVVQNLYTTAQRLVEKLLWLTTAHGHGFKDTARRPRITLSQLDLCDMLSLSRQTLSTELKKLESAGFIRVNYANIEVRDFNGLEALLKGSISARSSE